MKYKIGVYGSFEAASSDLLARVEELGRVLAERDVIVVTGACAGVPLAVATEAAQRGAEIWGFSSELNQEDQERVHKHKAALYSRIFYVPANYRELFFFTPEDTHAYDFYIRLRYRNVLSTAHCNACVLVSGRWGTLNEFTAMMYDRGKIIGVLTETGGANDDLEALVNKIGTQGKADVIFNRSPQELVDALLRELAVRQA
ncbi:hypothetical protein EPA93_09045 [Ktedonosporobacter rubrisoli]|uniref:Uncharacterized protein n=1 Tax=Ktedonosporobacter rubrisoli TaxID=2509675 RepID=A0A4P6JN52_KTERU|nr:hypothetical protein [Ktedonosporobacter rubrisoli]QBD76146.1 hypothetical protein EPA93_09045 [Ktedonosporobacter rubrisoli]